MWNDLLFTMLVMVGPMGAIFLAAWISGDLTLERRPPRKQAQPKA